MRNWKFAKTYKQVSILILFLGLFSSVQSQRLASLSAQDTLGVPETNWNNFKYDFVSIFGGVGYSYTRPLHWKGKQWGTLGAIAGGTALLHLFDKESSEFARRQKDGIPTFLRDYGSEFGSPQYNYMFTGGFYLVGLFSKNEKLRRTGEGLRFISEGLRQGSELTGE